MTEYVVYMDLADHREHKIHLTSCRWYLRKLDQMKAGVETPTTRWYGPYSSEQEAKLKTHVARTCRDCIPPTSEDPPRSDVRSDVRDVVVKDIDIPFLRIMEIVFQWGLAIFIWYLVAVVIAAIVFIILLRQFVNNQ